MSESGKQRPLVGFGVMVFKDGKVLLCKRKGSHGAGEYAFPGGSMEYMESFEGGARRETREECGLEIQNVKFLAIFNIKKYAPKHHVGIGFTADWAGGEPKILEPEKHKSWGWYDLDDLPQPIFEGSDVMIEIYRSGNNSHMYDS